MSNDRLTILVPAFNEAETLPELYRRVDGAMADQGLDWTFFVVDDGSSDQTWSAVRELGERHGNVEGMRLSRNFGKEIAMSAGLEHASGDAVVIIDADLQDPPELIPRFIEKWREGFDVVYGQRTDRPGETWLKKASARTFYRVINWLSSTPIPRDTGDFRLLSQRAVEALTRLREHHRFMKGLFAWIGYRQVAVEYQREPRHKGRSKFSYLKLWNFALDGVTSFSATPLRMATAIGLIAALGAVVYGFVVIVKTLVFGDPVAGYPSLMVTILFLGGVQLLALGVIGEYLGRLFDETKRRPLYLVDERLEAKAQADAARR